MRIEVQAIKMELKVRAQPIQHGQLLDFVRSIGKRHPKRTRPARQVKCNDASYYKSYTKSY